MWCYWNTDLLNTHTRTYTCTENMKGVYEENRGHWVLMIIFLWEMLHWVSVGETATLPLRTPMWAILGQTTLLPSRPRPRLPSPGHFSQESCVSRPELMNMWDSVGREISDNQKPRLHNVHLYHNILTLLLLHTAWQHLCSMCLS